MKLLSDSNQQRLISVLRRVYWMLPNDTSIKTAETKRLVKLMISRLSKLRDLEK